MNGKSNALRRFLAPLVVFLLGLIGFGLVSGDRLLNHSRDNHYVYLADSMLHGRLHLEGKPPHRNDWAKYGDKWYVSFPPAPGVLMIPGVAVFGLDFNDRLFTLFFAAAGPALLLLLMQLLVAQQRLDRRPRELFALAILYGFGTVYFFSAVQGSVWYTAHMVGGVLILLYAIFALEAKRPFLAGLCLGLAAACRPTLLMAFPFFIYEALDTKPAEGEESGFLTWLRHALPQLKSRAFLGRMALFVLPVIAVLIGLMAMNWIRFDDPFEFGHKYLQIRWQNRIARWGLFNFHYLARNLTVALALLPWISSEAPYIRISLHGLALWFTTPVLLSVLWPKKRTVLYTVLAITVFALALPNLLYQNSGWIQFGYRFALDFMVFLFLMLALAGRRQGALFFALSAFALAVNLFGAMTFDRHWEYYPAVSTQTYFEPD